MVVLSPIIASDRRFFEEGLDSLSIESRYTRFGQGISHLSAKELDYLTDVDQSTHVAWGAAVDGDIAGVGRYIALEGQCPEVALTLLDDFQKMGIGPVLFSALAAIARHDGHHELCFEATDDNAAVQKLLAAYELSPIVMDGSIDRRLRVSDLPNHPLDSEFVRVIEEVRATR